MNKVKKKLLLIEDDIIDQKAFLRIFNRKEFPFDYDVSGSVKEAINSLESKKYDVILADYSLGDGNAFDVLKVVENIPMVIVTGTGNEEIAVRAMKLGAYDYLIKDINGNYLKMVQITVENAIKHFNAEHRLQEYHKNLEKLVDERTAKLNMEIVERKQAEEELRLYEIIVSNSTDMLAVLNREYTYLAANSSYREAFKLTSEELIGRTVTEIFGKEFFETVIKQEADQCMNGIEVHYQEWFDFPAFKNNRYMEITYYPYKDKDNKMLGFVVNGRNITERKQAEEELTMKNLVFEHTISANSIANKEGIITYVNSNFLRIWGYKNKEEVVGKSISDFLKFKDETKKIIVALNESGGWEGEYTALKKDKTTFAASSLASVIKNKAGEMIGYQSSVLDITDRKDVEEELKKERNKLKVIMDAMDDGIYIVNKQFDIEYTNPAIEREFGSVNGQKCYQYFHDRKEVCAWCKNKEVFSGKSVRWEWYSSHNNKTYDLFDTPIINTDGSISKMKFFHDITELKEIEKELKKHQEHLEELVDERTKEIEAFSYSVSHDLRAPLRAISGFSEILSDEYKDKLDDEAKRLINVIRKNTMNMNQLITDLLHLSRLGRQQLKSVEINMKTLATTVYDELRQLYPDRDIKFKLGEIPSATGDRNLIKQVLTNLISNAIKFTEPRNNANIEIGSLQKNNQLFYYIKDNGIGFDMKYVDKIFGVFQSLHSPEEFEGTGVGLAIVHKIVHNHGGEIIAEGEVDKGAAFYFSLERR